MLIGKDLKEQRLNLCLSQADIAKRAGVSRQTIVALEQKPYIPLTAILDAYEMDVVPSKTTKESIDVLRGQIIDAVKDEFGDNCRVQISIELCGDEEAPEPIEPTFVDLDERVKEKGEE